MGSITLLGQDELIAGTFVYAILLLLASLTVVVLSPLFLLMAVTDVLGLTNFWGSFKEGWNEDVDT